MTRSRCFVCKATGRVARSECFCAGENEREIRSRCLCERRTVIGR